MSIRNQVPQSTHKTRKHAVSPTHAISALGGYTSPARMRRIFTALDRRFPHARWALKHRNAFQLLVAAMLSAQCTDKRVNQITPGLFQKYPSPQDFAALRPEVLERDIYSTGFFRNKARNITAMSKRIVGEFDAKVPSTMEELLTLPGVARKTANVVLGTAYGIASGIVVDTHVLRVATRRLRLSREKMPEKVEHDLLKLVPHGRWIQFCDRCHRTFQAINYSSCMGDMGDRSFSTVDDEVLSAMNQYRCAELQIARIKAAFKLICDFVGEPKNKETNRISLRPRDTYDDAARDVKRFLIKCKQLRAEAKRMLRLNKALM